jgi:hypothetical protein
MHGTVVTGEDPSGARRGIATAETEYWTTGFIAQTERVRLFDEAAGIGTQGCDFVGFLILAVLAGRYPVKIVSYILWQKKCHRVHTIHFIDEFFKEAIRAVRWRITEPTTRITVPIVNDIHRVYTKSLLVARSHR